MKRRTILFEAIVSNDEGEARAARVYLDAEDARGLLTAQKAMQAAALVLSVDEEARPLEALRLPWGIWWYRDLDGIDRDLDEDPIEGFEQTEHDAEDPDSFGEIVDVELELALVGEGGVWWQAAEEDSTAYLRTPVLPWSVIEELAQPDEG